MGLKSFADHDRRAAEPN